MCNGQQASQNRGNTCQLLIANCLLTLNYKYVVIKLLKLMLFWNKYTNGENLVQDLII